MPGFDGTGPMGAGPRTGRGLGYCTGGPRPGYGWGGYGAGRGGMPWGGGRGRAWGGGRGRGGWGPGYGGYGYGGGNPYGAPYPPDNPDAPYDPAGERAWLEAMVNDLQNELDSIQKRLAEIDRAQGGE